MADSYVYWKGSSAFNGEPILLILTGIAKASQNRKTGPVIQSWILREGVKPTEYRKQGADGICGSCPIKSACYVGNHYLNQIYDGGDRALDNFPLALLKGRVLRLGAYGDPAAVPYSVWERLLRWSEGWTGYTHAWHSCDQRFRRLCMASVESPEQMERAWELGWKTYRVGLPEEEPCSDELYCPHYTWEQEPTLQCLQCQLCSGLGMPGKKGVFVHVHGDRSARKNYRRVREQESNDSTTSKAQSPPKERTGASAPASSC